MSDLNHLPCTICHDLGSAECDCVQDMQTDLAAARSEIERLTKERDEARILASDRLTVISIAAKERDEARAMLADAERDMRQRAADKVRNAAAAFDPYAEEIVKALADDVLALPLKHADREGGV